MKRQQKNSWISVVVAVVLALVALVAPPTTIFAAQKAVAVAVPAAPGVGGGADVTDLGDKKTLIMVASTGDTVDIEVSADGTNFRPYLSLFGSSVRTLDASCTHVRANRKTGTGGTFDLRVVAQELEHDTAQSTAFLKGGEAAANETFAAAAVYQSNGARRIKSCKLVPSANVTANASNYATLTWEVRSAAGVVRGTACTTLTQTTGWTAYDDVIATAGAQLDLVDGDYVTLAVAKAGTGVQLPLLTSFIHFEP